MSKTIRYRKIHKTTFHDDDTCIIIEKIIIDKKIIKEKKTITEDKLKRKLVADRLVTKVIDINKYVYSDNTELTKEKHWDMLPEKKLIKDIVKKVM